jgi:hypothetical protein
MVPGGGLEPPHLSAADFESAASTDSAIPAWRWATLTYNGAPCEKRAHYPRIAVPLQPMLTTSLTLDDFGYALPPERIAQAPLPQRSASRLLAMQGATLVDHAFSDLPSLLQPGDLLVMNDTRVLHARLFGQKDSGGQIEVLVERLIDNNEVLAQVRASKPLRPGGRLLLEQKIPVAVIGREGEFYRLRFDGDAFATDRAIRPPAAAALHRPRGRRCRRSALPDGVRARPRLRCRTDCRTPFRRCRCCSGCRPREWILHTSPCMSGPVPSSRSA